MVEPSIIVPSTVGKLVRFNVMGEAIRERNEEREEALLSPFAMRASLSAGRLTFEDPDPVRTCFQRDRDRVLHCKSFRRLKHKTQVFIDPAGDHFRTRLTHTLEVAQVARTIGRALRLNEDLIEAIALAHDLGHPPFGHAGEEALDEAIRSVAATGRQEQELVQKGFLHSEQSLRVVDVLEALNLTEESRLGIGGHSKGRNDLSAHDGQPTSTLEAAVVRISDRIAYLAHDLDDAVRSGIITSAPSLAEPLGSTQSQRVGRMVIDVIEQSADRPEIRISPDLLKLMNELKEWLYENVYLHYPIRYPDTNKAQNLVKALFHHFHKAPAEGFDGLQGAVDYVAGMTDRFAIDTFAALTLPRSFGIER